MTSLWLAGFERQPVPSSGSFRPGSRPKLVLHTTESPTGSIRGAARWLTSQGSSPHTLVDPGTRERIQFIALNAPSKALRNERGGVETNREGVRQVEIVGRAHETPGWPNEWLDWLGREVVGPMAVAAGVPLDAPLQFYGDKAGFTVASAKARQRMSFHAWQNFSGVCGHQHCPENSHWDPGAMNVARVISAARAWAGVGQAAKAGPSAPPGVPALKAGDIGPAVGGLQIALNFGASQNLAGTSIFDAPTVQAVKNVQAWFHLDVDGVYGPKTQWVLQIACNQRANL